MMNLLDNNGNSNTNNNSSNNNNNASMNRRPVENPSLHQQYPGQNHSLASMFPTSGHQLDLNHLWGQVQELSGLLALNRENTAHLVKRTDEIRVGTTPNKHKVIEACLCILLLNSVFPSYGSTKRKGSYWERKARKVRQSRYELSSIANSFLAYQHNLTRYRRTRGRLHNREQQSAARKLQSSCRE